MSCTICLSILIGLAVALILKYLTTSKKKKDPPQLDPQEWWGPDSLKGKQDESIRPFEVEFTDEMVKDLRDRIKNHRPFTPPLEGVAFRYGFNTSQLPGWLQYWAEEYPFKEREQLLNKYPQYKTNIQGLDIHFYRVKPEVPAGVKIVPLLMMHGWPGSVLEFYESIPLLTQQKEGYDFVFELIIPSLPGYGFSDGAVRPGLGDAKMAVVFNNLMARLGFRKYYIQGGDWGAGIASAMVTLYPDDILGHHTTMAFTMNSRSLWWTLIGAFFPFLVVKPQLASRMYPLSHLFAILMEEYGYFHLQATKPDTVGVALSDSPAGLMAYILEKFSSWSKMDDRNLVDGGLHKRYTKEQLVDNLMMYWTSNSITTSMRMYAESFSQAIRDLNLDSYPTPVPTWALQPRHEVFYQPPGLLKYKFTNLVGHTAIEVGGHFLAFEMPSVFADDVFKAVKVFKRWNAQNGRSD